MIIFFTHGLSTLHYTDTLGNITVRSHLKSQTEINVHIEKKNSACPEIPAKYTFNGVTAPLHRNAIRSREIDLILESHF